MSVSATNESQNGVTVTNESTADTTMWSQHPESWAENQGTFASPGIGTTKESQNSVTTTNESQV